MASAVTALWVLVAKTVGSVSGDMGQGRAHGVSSVPKMGHVNLLLLSPQP